MKLLCALFSLSACLCIHLAAANFIPCLPAEFSHGYRDFLRRHLTPGAPVSMDYLAWTDYLKQTTNCDRSLTSILSPAERDKVEDICTPAAGKGDGSGNYCESRQKFTFVSVKSELGTCIVRNVSTVTQHIVVACDLVDGICRPTHLEEDRGLIWREFDRPCGFEVHMTDHGSELRATALLCLLLTLLPLALCYYLV